MIDGFALRHWHKLTLSICDGPFWLSCSVPVVFFDIFLKVPWGWWFLQYPTRFICFYCILPSALGKCCFCIGSCISSREIPSEMIDCLLECASVWTIYLTIDRWGLHDPPSLSWPSRIEQVAIKCKWFYQGLLHFWARFLFLVPTASPDHAKLFYRPSSLICE